MDGRRIVVICGVADWCDGASEKEHTAETADAQLQRQHKKNAELSTELQRTAAENAELREQLIQTNEQHEETLKVRLSTRSKPPRHAPYNV